jgi:TonB family protein
MSTPQISMSTTVVSTFAVAAMISFGVVEAYAQESPRQSPTDSRELGRDTRSAVPTDANADTLKVRADGDPDPDEFISLTVEPTFDYAEFVGRIVYPEEARKNGIEGRVLVRVLIDTTGTAVKFRIDHSDNAIFDTTAVDAVMRTKFTPAMQNEKAVTAWVTVPINFKIN